jgi:hypothetical protein
MDSFAFPAGERARQTLPPFISFGVVFRNCAGASSRLLCRNDLLIPACQTLTSEIGCALALCQFGPGL